MSKGDFIARVPPHVKRELDRMKRELPRNLRVPSNGDFVGALILEARRAQHRLPEQLTEYYEIKDAWAETGEEVLPDL